MIKAMSQVDYQLFTTLAKMNQITLLKSLRKYLKKNYSEDKMIVNQDYILCEGNIPIMLIAHMDTVFKEPPKEIFYDQQQRVIWSPQGLGADDRAGVFAILKILQKGYRPHICFTTEEERGGIGASLLINRIPKAPFDIKYIIELDRQGLCDCVFYDCDNEKFTEYVEKFGFITDWGTFTDISIICPAWKIAGVNLSVGYRDEHSVQEILNTNGLFNTVNNVCKMLDDIQNAPYFEYIENLDAQYYRWYGKYLGLYPEEDDYKIYSSNIKYQCCKCHKDYPEEDVFLVKTKYGTGRKYYCLDCVDSHIAWCSVCGEPFETDDENEKICFDCKEKK